MVVFHQDQFKRWVLAEILTLCILGSHFSKTHFPHLVGSTILFVNGNNGVVPRESSNCRGYLCQSNSNVGSGDDDSGGDNDDGDGIYLHLLHGKEHRSRGHPWLASTVVPSCVQHLDPTPV